MNSYGISVCVLLFSVFISSVSQILLKKAADKKYKNPLMEYINPLVAIAYVMFFGSIFLTMFALKKLPLSMSPILESTGYLFVSVLGYIFLKEKFGKKKIAGLLLILVGIAVFSL